MSGRIADLTDRENDGAGDRRESLGKGPRSQSTVFPGTHPCTQHLVEMPGKQLRDLSSGRAGQLFLELTGADD